MKIIIDIDECVGNNSCHQNATCMNKPGSYNCTCNKDDGGSDFEGNGTHCKGNIINTCVNYFYSICQQPVIRPANKLYLVF